MSIAEIIKTKNSDLFYYLLSHKDTYHDWFMKEYGVGSLRDLNKEQMLHFVNHVMEHSKKLVIDIAI